MIFSISKRFLVGLIAIFVINISIAFAVEFPALTGRVVDQMNLINTNTKTEIEAKLKKLEDETSSQFVVAVVRTLDGLEIRDYGVQLARHWALGQKQHNNGLLLLIAPNERKLAIEVGYGHEGVITDAFSYEVINSHITPKFKQGEMSAGIEKGVDLLIGAMDGNIDVQKFMEESKDTGFEFAEIIFFIIWWGIFLFIIGNIIYSIIKGGGSGGGGRTRRHSSTSFGSTSSSSSFSSGSSFSGGGGSFGGGGASGGW